jgi:diacylglycerol kinase family enzyme
MAADTATKLPPYLSPDREIYVVLSTLSGLKGAEAYFQNSLQPLLDEHEVKYSLRKTTSAESIIELCSNTILLGATKGVKQTMLLLSGDGGVVDIVNTLSTVLMRDTYDSRIGSIFVRPVIVLFPQGTANALAWSSKVAQDPIKTMTTGRPRPLPQFEATFSPGSKLVTREGQGREELGDHYDGDTAVLYGAVVFSWGLHASLVSMSDTTEYRKHGTDRFKMAAEKLLTEGHVYRGYVKLRAQRDGEWEDLVYPSPTDNEHAYVLCPLVSNLEETFHISPATTPVSNTLRLLAIDPTKGAGEIMQVLTLAYQEGGPHVKESSVVYREIDGLRIEFQEYDAQWRQVCVDGKIIEVPKGGFAEVRMLPAMGMDGRRVVELVVPS